MFPDEQPSQSRRTFLAASVATGVAAAFIPKRASAAPTTVNVVGNPGLHYELWRKWAAMVAEETKGEIQIKYDPIGYAPAYGRIKQEVETKNFATDVFYNDAPYPEQLWNEGLLQEIPYAEMPNAQKLFAYARRPYGIELLNTVWGIVGFNTNFVKVGEFKLPLSWEEFADPRWKGKLSWVDPRAFPMWLPVIVNAYGEDKWVDYCRRIDRNVKTYHSRWVDNRIGMQRGDSWITFHAWATIYIGAVVDKASVSGLPITSPPRAMGNLPVSMSILKSAPNRAATVRMMDIVSKPEYTKVMMDIGLNPSNHPDNYPHPMPNRILEANNAALAGVKQWTDIQALIKPIDWIDWAKKIPHYTQVWETEVFKRRGS